MVRINKGVSCFCNLQGTFHFKGNFYQFLFFFFFFFFNMWNVPSEPSWILPPVCVAVWQWLSAWIQWWTPLEALLRDAELSAPHWKGWLKPPTGGQIQWQGDYSGQKCVSLFLTSKILRKACNNSGGSWRHRLSGLFWIDTGFCSSCVLH